MNYSSLSLFFIKNMGFIYLIGEVDNSNTFKIGVTKKQNIEERKKELQTGNSNELYINQYFETKYPYKIEKMLHMHFYDKKLINEWFSLDNDDIKSFKETCNYYEEICNALKDNPFF